jgi:hypothetical protein
MIEEDSAIMQSLEKKSQITALLTFLAGTSILGAIIYASLQLTQLTKQVEEKHLEIRRLAIQVEDLRKTESAVLEFFNSATNGEEIKILDPTVDWPAVKISIINMRPGRRQQAVFGALLYAWKEIPFKPAGQKLSEGFDSPRFLQRVLLDVGVKFQTSKIIPVSASIMSQLNKVENPLSGDLVFYHGQEGSFGFILLSTGTATTPPTGIGTLQKDAPLQVIRLDNVNTNDYPLIGYFQVKYPDE